MRPVRGLIALLLLGFGLQAQPGRFGVDPRVELMSIIFRLAGSNEYMQGWLKPYNAAIDSHFAAFREHQAIRIAREVRKSDGVSFDAVMNMAIHVKDVETLAERAPFDKSTSLDHRWHGAKARKFLEAARQFVADSDFAGFWKSQQPLYEATNARLQEFVAKNADLAWFDKFFGPQKHAPFVVAPGLVNGGASYGANIKFENGDEEIYAMPGVWDRDENGIPIFDASWNSTLVHEFAHSYVGPLVDQYWPQLEKPGDRLFQPFRKEMSDQAYGNGKNVVNESIVRAATARYALEHEGPEAAARAVSRERNRSFLWTSELLEVLGKYADDRQHYPTMATFMPQVVACFENAAGRVGQTIRDYENGRPKVVSMTIANGAKDVDPGLKEIVVTFDREMNRKTYAVAHEGGPPQPKMGKVSFDESGKVLTIPVTLEPDQEYGFTLNWTGGGSFQSREGILLKPVAVRFKTRAAQ